jgi:hypothetical protein
VLLTFGFFFGEVENCYHHHSGLNMSREQNLFSVEADFLTTRVITTVYLVFSALGVPLALSVVFWYSNRLV